MSKVLRLSEALNTLSAPRAATFLLSEIDDIPLELREHLMSADTTRSLTNNVMEILKMAHGKIPVCNSIALMPNTVRSAEEYQQIMDLIFVNTYLSVIVSSWVAKDRPNGWNWSNGKDVMEFMKSMSSYYGLIFIAYANSNSPDALFFTEKNSYKTYSTGVIESAQLHTKLMQELFATYNFPKDTLKQLDSIMTGVAQSLRDLSITFTETNSTTHHFISMIQIGKSAKYGKDLPMIETFYLSISQKSWVASKGKSGTENKFEFSMNYGKVLYSLPELSYQMARQRDFFTKEMNLYTNQSLFTLQEITKPNGINF